MKNIFLQDDIKLIEDRLKKFEANTGCELLLIVAQESDEYPGALWRFAIMFGFAVTFSFSVFLEFHHGYYWPLFMFAMTYVGRLLAGLTFFKKLSLSDVETERETTEKAIEYFHTMGTSKVSHKVTAMIMVSLLEKQIIVLIDDELKSKMTKPEIDELVQIMRQHFKSGNMGMGFVQSIESLETKILNDFGGKVSDVSPSELCDTIRFL